MNIPIATLTLAAVREAHARIRDKIIGTPVLTNDLLNAGANAKLFFKCENLQKIGAFKARGATNAVFSLADEEAQRGVVTHSSGNHGAALARAAKLRAIRSYIVMPDNSPASKRAAVRAFGGEIVFCAPTMQAREHTASQVMASTGAVFIHPYDDLRVMAGQGTATLELLEQVQDLDIILCPVGGGGLLSGTAVVAKALNPSIRVMGVEPAAADDAYRSFRAGHLIQCPSPQTVADGLRASLGVRPFAEIKTHVSEIVTVTEEGIIQTMRLIWEAMKLVVEPSGAVAYAAIVERKIDVARQKVGIVLSGGNLDLDRLPWQPHTTPTI